MLERNPRKRIGSDNCYEEFEVILNNLAQNYHTLFFRFVSFLKRMDSDSVDHELYATNEKIANIQKKKECLIQ